MSTESKVPAIGSAVLVSFYSGLQQLSTVVAHVLAITGSGAGLDTADGIPALTVAYPDPTADPSILSSANWQKAYVRKTGVVNFTHELAVSGKESIVWGYPVEFSELPSLIKPEAPAINPVFDRPVDVEVPEVPLGQHGAVTLRSESEDGGIIVHPAAQKEAEKIAESKAATEADASTSTTTEATEPAGEATEATETATEPTS